MGGEIGEPLKFRMRGKGSPISYARQGIVFFSSKLEPVLHQHI